MRALLTLLIFFSLPVHADVLLVFSSSLGFFSETFEIDHGMERLGAEFVKAGIGRQYRQVHLYAHKDLTKFDAFFQRVSSELQGNEKIDVFSMQHGPISTPFINFPIVEVLNHLPPGRIRNVYNSACSEWGRIVKDWNRGLSFASAQRTQDAYFRLEASMFALHANDNSSGFLSLGLLMKELGQSSDWVRGIRTAFENYDRLITDLIADVADATKDGSLQSFLGDQYFSKLHAFLTKTLRSRVVIQSKQKLPWRSSWSPRESVPDYFTGVIGPSDDLEAKWRGWCQNYAQDMRCSFTGGPRPGGIRRVFEKLASYFASVFATISAPGSQCLPPSIPNAFLRTAYGSEEFSLEQVCLVRTSSGIKLNWEWKEHFDLKGLRGLRHLREILFSRLGSFEIITERDLKLKLAGVRLKVEETILGKPRTLILAPAELRLTDDATATVKVQLGGFVPVSVGSSSLQTITLPDFVNLFGVPVWRSR